MEWQNKDIIKLKLISAFEDSFFNENEEFIAHKYSNTYFIFYNCKNTEDVNCKIIEWFSRPAYQGSPYKSEWRNKAFRQFMLEGINKFLKTNFSEDDMGIIYEYLGNACDHEKTKEFIKSGYDMSILKG